MIKYHIGPSRIHGQGIILNININKDQIIDSAIYEKFRIFFFITKNFGRYINHSYRPTGYLIWNSNKSSWDIAALYSLRSGTEITVDYRYTPNYIKKPEPSWE